jgi:hypothetical protein
MTNRTHLQNRKMELSKLNSFYKDFELFHKEVELSSAMYQTMIAKISSRMAFIERSINDHSDIVQLRLWIEKIPESERNDRITLSLRFVDYDIEGYSHPIKYTLDRLERHLRDISLANIKTVLDEKQVRIFAV